jgi:HEAT repeat protein
MKASGDVGEVIVKPLAHVVQVGAEERAVVAAADALSRFAGRAQKATPALIARLRDLRGVKPIFLLRALERLADPRAAHVLRDYVAHEDLFVATAAAKALKASGGKDVVDLLVQRLPKEIESHEMLGAVAAILEVIHGMQPLVAERLVVERFLGNDQLMKQRTWLRRLRDGLKNR